VGERERRERRDQLLRADAARGERSQVRRRHAIDVVPPPGVERDQDQDRLGGRPPLRRKGRADERARERQRGPESRHPSESPYMSLGLVTAGAMATVRTELVRMNPLSVPSSIRKTTWMLRSFRKLPPSELPARRAGVNTGK